MGIRSYRVIAPSIIKMDQATVLEAFVRCIKQLQTKVKALEAQLVQDQEPLPQIEARILDGNVLIRIQCVNCRGVLVKALKETEKLNLSVVNSCVMPFGASTLYITLVAQMDGEFIMTVKELEECLRLSLIQFMEKNGV